jgi:hypothetical protein
MIPSRQASVQSIGLLEPAVNETTWVQPRCSGPHGIARIPFVPRSSPNWPVRKDATVRVVEPQTICRKRGSKGSAGKDLLDAWHKPAMVSAAFVVGDPLFPEAMDRGTTIPALM